MRWRADKKWIFPSIEDYPGKKVTSAIALPSAGPRCPAAVHILAQHRCPGAALRHAGSQVLADLTSASLPSWQELFFPLGRGTQALEFLSAPLGEMREEWERSFVALSPLSPHLPLKPPPEAIFKPLWECWVGDARRREEAGMAVAAG